MEKDGKVEITGATIYWSTEPTRMDKVGRNGFYIKQVKLLPFHQWPFKWKLVALKAIIFGSLIAFKKRVVNYLEGVDKEVEEEVNGKNTFFDNQK